MSERCPVCRIPVKVYDTIKIDMLGTGEMYKGREIAYMRVQRRRCPACKVEGVQTLYATTICWIDSMTGQYVHP